jgi:hypothetical protein
MFLVVGLIWAIFGFIGYLLMLNEKYYFEVIGYSKFTLYCLIPILYTVLGVVSFHCAIRYLTR